MRAYRNEIRRDEIRETAMMKRLAAGAAVLALAAGLSGCIIIASEGGERTVVVDGRGG